MAINSRKAGDGVPDVRRARGAEASGLEGAERPLASGVYTGRVTSRQGDGTYIVTIASPKMDVKGVQLALPIFGGLLGVHVNSHLPPGTAVAITYGDPSFIVARLPEKNDDWKNAKNRAVIGGDKMDPDEGVEADVFSNAPEDLIEGETEIGNLHGVAVDFLTSIMRLRAGDLAAVECHLINDMVRVISRQYRHISGLGDDLIFDHGRPTMERSWSSYRHEVFGALRENEALIEMKGDEADPEKLEEKRLLALGRHRLKEFTGFAGDFIHSFVADPPAALVELVKEQQASSGKSMFHRNSDGSVILQSVADIRIERVTRIPVPKRVKSHEDPRATRERAYDELNAAFIKLPLAVTQPDPKDAFKAAYHIRTYSRWLSRYHAFARMLQLDKEYDIESEEDTPKPTLNNLEQDKQRTNPTADDSYIDTYACMTIMRDGSIVHHDGYGSTITMSNGNVQVSASRHLDLEAAGDIRILAGGSIFAKAKRNIEMSCTAGNMYMHAYGVVKMLCEAGSIWLRSNAKGGAKPEIKDEGPEPVLAMFDEESYASGDTPCERGSGVLIEAPQSAITVRANEDLRLATDSRKYAICASSNGQLRLHGRKGVSVHTRKKIALSSNGMIALACRVLISDARRFILGTPEAPRFVFKGQQLWVPRIKTYTLKANTARSRENARGGHYCKRRYIRPHKNHVHVLRRAVTQPKGLNPKQAAFLEEAIVNRREHPADEELCDRGNLTWKRPSQGPRWSFADIDEYVWDAREEYASAVPETLTQQYLRLDQAEESPGGDRWGGAGYTKWAVRNRIKGRRTDRPGGWGFYNQQLRASNKGKPLRQPSPQKAKNTQQPVISWSPKKFTIQALNKPL